MKEKTILVLVMLILSVPAVFSEHNSFSIDYTFQPVFLEGQWTIKDTYIQEIPGEPVIPYRVARILLPQGAEIEGIKVTHGAPIVQEGFDIPWGQPSRTSGNYVQVGKDHALFNSTTWYPDPLYRVGSVESYRGFNILYVNLYPVQYQPKSKTVRFYEKLTITVQFSKRTNPTLYRGSRDKNAVVTMVDNPEVLTTYSDLCTTASPLLTQESHEYIIITNSTLASTFQPLADHKDNFITGTTEIVDVQWIYSNYSGVDNQEKIRNFIKDAYNTWGTSFCLLGGDIAVVPYRGFYVENSGYVDSDMAADMYYGCLDGTFNDDGDSRWAEPGDGVDWLEEVFVGRAPVETVEEAQIFVEKVINYELAEREKVCQYHASGTGDPDPRQLAWDCEYWTPSDYVKKELFEIEQPITKALWRSAWDGSYDGTPNYPPVMFQHCGHGTTECYNIGSGVTWYTSDIPSLTNTNFWPVHMSVSSYCGEFEANDCLAEVYVYDDAGAIACMMNDSMAWFSSLDISMYSGDFIETMFRALFSDEKEHLGELLNQAKSYWVAAAETSSTYRWCYYEYNLLGDPESMVLTQRVIPQPGTVTITHPEDGSDVYGKVTITTSVTGCIDMVEFYIDGEFKYTDTAAPFSYTWDTFGYTEDRQHTIVVKGYCAGEYKDTDSVTVTVNNLYIRITNPQEGEVVSGIVTVTTEVRGYDTVEFYIDSVLKYIDIAAPFQYEWDTKEYQDGEHRITAKAYASGVIMGKDEVTCIVNNSGQCSGTVLILLLVLFGSAGILRRC